MPRPGLGYIDQGQHDRMATLVRRCRGDLASGDLAAAFKSCEAIEVAKNVMSGGVHDQDSRRYADYHNLTDLVDVDAAVSENRGAFLTNVYLDLPAVRRALHVPASLGRSLVRDGNQLNTTRGLWLGDDNARSTLALYPNLIANLRVLVYNGNFDVVCNHLGTERFMASLGSLFPVPEEGAAYTASCVVVAPCRA